MGSLPKPPVENGTTEVRLANLVVGGAGFFFVKKIGSLPICETCQDYLVIEVGTDTLLYC